MSTGYAPVPCCYSALAFAQAPAAFPAQATVWFGGPPSARGAVGRGRTAHLRGDGSDRFVRVAVRPCVRCGRPARRGCGIAARCEAQACRASGGCHEATAHNAPPDSLRKGVDGPFRVATDCS